MHHAFSDDEVAAARDAFLPVLLAAAQAPSPALDLLSDAAGAVVDVASLRAFGWDFVREARDGAVAAWERSHWLERRFPESPDARHVLALGPFLLPGAEPGRYEGADYEEAVRSGRPLRAFFRSLGVWRTPPFDAEDPECPPPAARFSPLPDEGALPALRSEIFEAVDEAAKDPLEDIRAIAEGESRERMPEMFADDFSEPLWRYVQAGWSACHTDCHAGLSRLLATVARPFRAPSRFPEAVAALRSVSHPEAVSELLLLALDSENVLHFLPVFAYALSQERFLASPWRTFRHFGMIADACTRFCFCGGLGKLPPFPAHPLPSVPARALALRLALGYLERAVDAAVGAAQEGHAAGLAMRTVLGAFQLLADAPRDPPGADRAALRELADALSRFFLSREGILGAGNEDEEAAARALSLHAAGAGELAVKRLEEDMEAMRKAAPVPPRLAEKDFRPPLSLVARISWQVHQALAPPASQKAERWRVAARAWPCPACDVFGGVVSPSDFTEEAGVLVAPPLHLTPGFPTREEIAQGLFPLWDGHNWRKIARKILSEGNACVEGRTEAFEQADMVSLGKLAVAERVEPPASGYQIRPVLPLAFSAEGGEIYPYDVTFLAGEFDGEGRIANFAGMIRALYSDPLFGAGVARFQLGRGDQLTAYLPFFAADHDKLPKAASMAGFLWMVALSKEVGRIAKKDAARAVAYFVQSGDGNPRCSFRGKVLSVSSVPFQFVRSARVKAVLLDCGGDMAMEIPLFAAAKSIEGSQWLRPGDWLEGEANLCADFHGFSDRPAAWRKRLERPDPPVRVRPAPPDVAAEGEEDADDDAETAAADYERAAHEELVWRLGSWNVAVCEPNPWRVAFVTREKGEVVRYALEILSSPDAPRSRPETGVKMLSMYLDRSGPKPRYRLHGFPPSPPE